MTRRPCRSSTSLKVAAGTHDMRILFNTACTAVFLRSLVYFFKSVGYDRPTSVAAFVLRKGTPESKRIVIGDVNVPRVRPESAYGRCRDLRNQFDRRHVWPTLVFLFDQCDSGDTMYVSLISNPTKTRASSVARRSPRLLLCTLGCVILTIVPSYVVSSQAHIVLSFFPYPNGSTAPFTLHRAT